MTLIASTRNEIDQTARDYAHFLWEMPPQRGIGLILNTWYTLFGESPINVPEPIAGRFLAWTFLPQTNPESAHAPPLTAKARTFADYFFKRAGHATFQQYTRFMHTCFILDCVFQHLFVDLTAQEPPLEPLSVIDDLPDNTPPTPHWDFPDSTVADEDIPT